MDKDNNKLQRELQREALESMVDDIVQFGED